VTNLKTFSDAILTANGFSTPINATLATVTVATPTTSSTATLLTLNVGASTGNSTDGFNYGVAVTLTNLTQYTQSLFVKPAGATVLRLRSNTSGLIADFTLTGNGTAPSLSAELQGASIAPFANGWYRVSWTFTSTTSIPGNRSDYWTIKTNVADGTNGLYLVGAQLEQASTVGEYVPTTSAINSAPRFDHNPTTGESLGLLVEEARTNLLFYSEQLNDGVWGPVSGTVTANAETSPANTLTADKLIAANGGPAGQLAQGATITSGATVTASAYAKAGGFDRLELVILASNNTTPYGRSTFNPNTGVITTAAFTSNGGTNASSAVQALSNGWYRFSVTVTYPAVTSAGMRLLVSNSDAANGDGVKGVFLWGAQLEVGAFPTSYIPTTSATVTRAADVASVTGSNFSSFYNETEGTVFAEAQLQSIAARSAAVFDINDNSTNNRIVHRQITTGADERTTIRSGGAQVASLSVGSPTLLSRKMADVYKINDFAATANGVAVATSTSGAVPVSVSQMLIGFELGPQGQLGGTIKRLTYWPVRLSNTTLQQITQP
jgi:hypothetical protein